MIRTQELLAARMQDGAEQYFSTAYEFGFSKSEKEALAIWDHQKVLSDVVWVIRKFQLQAFFEDPHVWPRHEYAQPIVAIQDCECQGQRPSPPSSLRQR